MGMLGEFGESLKHGWNAFRARDEEREVRGGFEPGGSFGFRPDRNRLSVSNDRSIISSIYTRIAIDVAAHDIRHVKNDAEGRYVSDVNSGLNYCLSEEANLDHSLRQGYYRYRSGRHYG
jgi:hypothetical protein